ncbi:hypothetical protein L837_5179 [Mycobacterium avium MAV_061107_1842]|nr:hypothetical protein L837_5179 [Mycobacterium avium MAV_061107_1842]
MACAWPICSTTPPTTGHSSTRTAAPSVPRRPRGLGPLPARITAPRQHRDHQWRRVRVYTYLSPSGEPVQQVIREECACTGNPHKQFRQRYRDAHRWVYRKPRDFTPVLYGPTQFSGRPRPARGYGLPKARKTPTP